MTQFEQAVTGTAESPLQRRFREKSALVQYRRQTAGAVVLAVLGVTREHQKPLQNLYQFVSSLTGIHVADVQQATLNMVGERSEQPLVWDPQAGFLLKESVESVDAANPEAALVIGEQELSRAALEDMVNRQVAIDQAARDLQAEQAQFQGKFY